MMKFILSPDSVMMPERW